MGTLRASLLVVGLVVLSLGCKPAPLTLSPEAADIAVGNTVAFTAAGGSTPYTFSFSGADGALDGAIGTFTASAPGTATVRVTDKDGAQDEAVVTIHPSLRIGGATLPSHLSAPYPVYVEGGVPPVTVSRISGTGSVNASGEFTPQGPAGITQLQATDAFGNTATAELHVTDHLANNVIYQAVHVGSAWYLGGDFTVVHPYPAGNVVAFNESGRVRWPCDFAGGFNDTVRTTLVVGDVLFAGGDFTRFKGAAAHYVARIDLKTCTLDTTFSPPGVNNGFDESVRALASSNGALYVGGDFELYRDGQPANHLAKLDAVTGALDTQFTTGGFNAIVNVLAASDAALYVGGEFTQYRSQDVDFVAKLDTTTGNLDASFSAGAGSGADAPVLTLAMSNDTLYLGGYFLTYRGSPANGIAKVSVSSGDLDTTFSPSSGPNGFDNSVNALVLHQGALYVGGGFLNHRGAPARRIAKLDPTTGALDVTFSPPTGPNGFDDNVQALTAMGDHLYILGDFTAYRDASTGSDPMAKLDLNGVAQPFGAPQGSIGFQNPLFLSINAVDGTLFVTGRFQDYGGQSAQHIAKLSDTDWALDTTFSPPDNNGFNDNVLGLVSDGFALYASGLFTQYRGGVGSALRLAKLDPTSGALDTTFSPPGIGNNGFDNNAWNIALSSDAVFVVGDFSNYRSVGAHRLVKLNKTTGAMDTTFSPPGAEGLDGSAFGLVVNGTSVYVGGSFSAYRGVANTANRIAKLDLTSGAIDTTFSPPGVTTNGFNGTVQSLAVSGGAVYAVGGFTNYRSAAIAPRLAKLDATTGALDTTFNSVASGGLDAYTFGVQLLSGAVYVHGAFTTYRGQPASHVAKIDSASGTLDTTFNPGTGNGFDVDVNSLVLVGPRLMASGSFSSYRGAGVTRVAWLEPTSGALLP